MKIPKGGNLGAFVSYVENASWDGKEGIFEGPSREKLERRGDEKRG